MIRPAGLGTKLRRLLAMLDGDVQAVYDELGVPFRPRFYPIARLLLDAGPSRVNDIARLTEVTQPAATQTIAEMVRLGLVRVSPGADRRSREVSLTDEGSRLAAELAPVWESIARAAAALERELPAALTAVLDGAVEALERESFGARIRANLSTRRPT